MDAISWQLLIEGAWTTLWISAIAIAFGVAIGLLIALVRMLRIPVIDQLLVVYISLARATPLVTLVLFLFLSLPTVGINLDKNAGGGGVGRDAPLDLLPLHHAAADVD